MDVLPLTELDDDLFASALAVVQQDDRELDPSGAPITDSELRLLAADDRTGGDRHERFAVVRDGHVAVVAHVELDVGDDNPHLASAEIFGLRRDRDAGRCALAAVLDVAEADGRTSLMGWGPHNQAEGAFWTELGAEMKYTERMSTLDVAAVDGELMQEWIDGRTARAADVELVRWIGPCPDEHLDSWILSRTAMNDAPTDGLDINDWTLDAGDIREDEDAYRVLGTRLMNLFALDSDGEPVGHTSIHVNPHRTDGAWQWDTAVLDRHRQRGVGRWLKAEMWKWLRRDEPAVTRLWTGNAESNAAMLSINVAMGFREAVVYGAWQAPISTYRAGLE